MQLSLKYLFEDLQSGKDITDSKMIGKWGQYTHTPIEQSFSLLVFVTGVITLNT